MSERKTPKDYHALAEVRGLIWLGPEVQNVFEKTSWRCPSGHEWQTAYKTLTRFPTVGCPACAGKSRKIPEDYFALALQRDIEWLGPFPKNSHEHTRWRCRYGHEWETDFNSIKTGRSCPACGVQRGAKKRALKPDDYQSLALERGIEWLGPLVASNSSKTSWRCAHGHTFRSSYNKVQRSRLFGCRQCGNRIRGENTRLKPAVYQLSASTRGFRWLGSQVIRTTEKTSWRCSEGHVWVASYNNVINNGSGCPRCKDIVNGFFTSKPQRAIHKMIGGSLNFRVGRYGIDVAIEWGGIPIAIEYDCWYWHKDTVAHESKRDAYLIRHGWRILHIRANTEVPTLEQLQPFLDRLANGSQYEELILDWPE